MNETRATEDEFDDEFNQMLEETLEQTYKAIEERDYQEYDGIVGEPPHWVPEWAVTWFKSDRNRLLDARGYTHEGLLTLIAQYSREYYREEYIDETEVSNFYYPATYPNGKNVDPFCFRDEIGFLSWLKYCVDQGGEAGLEIIGGGFALSGIKAATSLEAARDSRHTNSRESKEFCVINAQELWSKQVQEGGGIYRMGEMARALFCELINKQLYAPESERQIRVWLRDAAKDGKLYIPPDASRRGRPKE